MILTEIIVNCFTIEQWWQTFYSCQWKACCSMHATGSPPLFQNVYHWIRRSQASYWLPKPWLGRNEKENGKSQKYGNKRQHLSIYDSSLMSGNRFFRQIEDLRWKSIILHPSVCVICSQFQNSLDLHCNTAIWCKTVISKPDCSQEPSGNFLKSCPCFTVVLLNQNLHSGTQKQAPQVISMSR